MQANRIIATKRSLITATAVAAVASAAASFAGTATIGTPNGPSAIFEYRDNMLRINNEVDPQAYAVLRDGSFYTVAVTNGVPLVMDAGAMMKRMAGAPGMPVPDMNTDISGQFVSLKPLGRSETIAGITGEVYEVRWVNDKGTEQSETLVLSEDEHVVEFTQALRGMAQFAAETAGVSRDASEAARELEQRLDGLKAGVLRFGDQMTVLELDGSETPKARFELPAAPMDLKALMGG